MFDYLSQELPSLQYSLGLFTVTGVASGLLANYLPHKNAFCNYKYNFSDSKTMLGKGLIFGVVVGLAAHYGAERGRRVYLDRTAFSNSMKVIIILFDRHLKMKYSQGGLARQSYSKCSQS